MEDVGDLSFADLTSLTEREILILNVHETHELKNRVGKVEEGIEQLKASPMCNDHEIRITKLETTQKVAIGILGAMIPVIIWILDKVI